ncbi:MAG: regulatory iron-sulfur-containing complex subunit RicT [Gemmatimonadota bacterium]
MSQTVEVRFKGNRRAFFDWHDAASPLKLNEPVVVEVERGLDYGWVNATGDAAEAKCGGCTSCGTSEPPTPTLVATSDDTQSPRPEGTESPRPDNTESPRPEGGASRSVQTPTTATGDNTESPRPEGGASRSVQPPTIATGDNTESPRPEGGASQPVQTPTTARRDDPTAPTPVGADPTRETPPSGRGDATEGRGDATEGRGDNTEGPGDTPAKPAPLAKVVRRADANAVRQHEELRRGEEDVRRQVMERAKAHELPMRISDTEWQWDRGRLSIYFTADRRVDFRALVRELATRFRTRIELRQIGVRDEAARLGGVGRCGREYCCSTWLTEPGPVNLALAKDQHLSLNPAQISGGCGRLLCCLKYEHEFYVTARKRFPKEGKLVRTLRGNEKVVAVDIFRERVFLRHDEQGPRILTLLDLRDELEQAQLAGDAAPAVAAPPPRQERPSGRPPRDREGPPRA